MFFHLFLSQQRHILMFCPLHFIQKHKGPFGTFPKRLQPLALLNPIHKIYTMKYEKLVDLVQEMVEVLLLFKTRLKPLGFFLSSPSINLDLHHF